MAANIYNESLLYHSRGSKVILQAEPNPTVGDQLALQMSIGRFTLGHIYLAFKPIVRFEGNFCPDIAEPFSLFMCAGRATEETKTSRGRGNVLESPN